MNVGWALVALAGIIALGVGAELYERRAARRQRAAEAEARRLSEEARRHP